MKKNVMMRIASVMLIMVLLTSSVISGTFAKYVTNGKGEDDARVAKFGVVVKGDSEIFDAHYMGVEEGWTTKLTVEASTANTDLVAPGTTKTMAEVKITGQPEVAVRVTNDVETFDLGVNWVVDGVFYCPLVFTIYDALGVKHEISGLDYTDVTKLEDDVIKAIETAKAEYAPNTLLDDLENNEILKFTWEWAFEGSTNEADLTYGQTDVKDTALGDAAAANLDNAGTIAITVVTYVTQID